MTAPTPERRVGEELTAAQEMTLAVALSRVERTEPLVFALVELMADRGEKLESEVAALHAEIDDCHRRMNQQTAEVERLTNRVEELEFEVCGPVPDDDPVRPLGEWLAERLDDDIWRAAERHLDQVRASFASLTAEVERLTKEKARASQMAFEEGAVWGFTRPTGAAIQAEAVRRYPLPTPAPEACPLSHEPNAETARAIEEARQGINVTPALERAAAEFGSLTDERMAIREAPTPAPEANNGR